MTQSAATPLGSALARLQTRWGSAAVRMGTGADEAKEAVPINGSLALVPQPVPGQPAAVEPSPSVGEGLPSGLRELDALLGPHGLPRAAAASLRGAGSSGKTTVALHWLAQAQAQGAIVAYLDLGRTFDPLEAVARGIDLRWLLVLRPADVDEGFALAAALLAGRAVDLLVIDLPERLMSRHDVSLRRLAAHARRVGARLIVLEPAALSDRLHTALAEATGLRLELEQQTWLRLGRDVIGRRIGISVAKNRFGPPGRKGEIEIRYLTDGELTPTAARLAEVDAA